MTAPADISAGQVLAGKYRVDRMLGQGGMGVVVEARHISLEDRVALKFLLPEYSSHPEAAARFMREARAAVKIKGPHVARVSDVGTLENGAPYMVMEYLDGTDASKVLERGVLPPTEAIDYVVQACDAISEAHSLGIIHRDLKPANLFVTRHKDGTPFVKVLDFGISKVVGEGGTDGLTRTSATMGSALYMSPEQIRQSKSVDHRTDIYALGVTLYELLTGRQPYVAESFAALCVEIATGVPAPLAEQRPDLPPGLIAAIEKAYVRDPAQRYQSVAEFCVALAPWALPRSQHIIERVARSAGLVPSLSAAPPADPSRGSYASITGVGHGGSAAQTGMNVAGTMPPKTRSMAVPLIAGGVFFLLLVGGIGVAVMRTSNKPAPDATVQAALDEPAPAAAPVSESPKAELAPVATKDPPKWNRPRPRARRPNPRLRRPRSRSPHRRPPRARYQKSKPNPKSNPMHPNLPSNPPALGTNVSFLRLLLILLLVTFAAPALAGDRALAEALFLDGKRLLDEKKFAEACTKFEASQRQDPSPGTLLNLGRCNEEQGKTATAWARYTEAATLAQNMSRPEQETAARERVAALEPKLSRLEIKPPATAIDGLSVKRGGATMGADSLGIAAPVDPGTYNVEASAPGYETWKGSVTVKPDGDSASIQIPDLKQLPEGAVPEGSEGSGQASGGVTSDKPPGGNKTLGYVLTGVGGVALIAGGVFGFLAQKQAKDAEDDPSLCPNKVCSSKGRDEIDGAKSKALISTIGIGVGVAALGAGIYFIVASPSGEKAARATTRPRVIPLLDPRAPGVSLSGAF